MNEPTDPEKQLRDILKAHAVDSEHLLDEVLRDAQRDALRGGMFAAAMLCDQYARQAEATVEPGVGMLRSLAKELRSGIEAAPEPWRSLSALREAVGPFVAVARAVDPVFIRDDNTVWHAGPSAVVTVGDCRKLLAAHDAAPAEQPECPTPRVCEYHGCEHKPAAPTPPHGRVGGSHVTLTTPMARLLPAAKAAWEMYHQGERPWEAELRDSREVWLCTIDEALAAAPTLTLEEVDGAMRKGGVDPATARSVRGILEAKIRVAQKGAGRGDR